MLCGSLSFSLMWTAVEKFLYPQWTIASLLQHPQMTLGFDWPIVVTIAGFVEFSLAFYLAIGRGLLRFGAVAFMAVFLSAMPEFGYLDLVGHVLIVAILLVMCMSGASPMQDALRLPGRGVVANAAGVSALYLVTLSVLFGMYYGMQRTVGHVIPTAESSDLSDHAVPQDASVWAQVNIFADWYKMLAVPGRWPYGVKMTWPLIFGKYRQV